MKSQHLLLARITDQKIIDSLGSLQTLESLFNLFKEDQDAKITLATRPIKRIVENPETGQKVEEQYLSVLDFVLQNCGEQENFKSVLQFLSDITRKDLDSGQTVLAPKVGESEIEKKQENDVDIELFEAIKKQNTEEVQRLLALEEKPEPSKINSSGNSPIHLAAHIGNLEIFKLLIQSGNPSQNLNLQNTELSQPLHVATKNALKNKGEVLEYLLSDEVIANIDVNCRDKNGLTPLYYAANNGDVKTMRLLLAKGANPNAVDINGFGIIYGCMMSRKIEALQLLLEQPNINLELKNYEGSSPLALAIRFDNLEYVRMLVEKGAQTKTLIDSDCPTSLHYAATVAGYKKNSDFQVLKYLASNVGIDYADEKGITVFDIACRLHSDRVALFLIENGYEPNFSDSFGASDLHYSAIAGLLNTSMLLVERGAESSSLSKENITPIECAIVHKNFGVAIFLLQDAELKGELTTKPDLLTKALYAAFASGSLEFFKYFLKVYQDRLDKDLTPLFFDVANNYQVKLFNANHLTIIDFLITNNQIKVNCLSEDGSTPLHGAVASNNHLLVEFLLKNGADIAIKNNFGITPADIIHNNDSGKDVARLIRIHNLKLKAKKFFIDHGLNVPQEIIISQKINEKDGSIFFVITLSEKEISFAEGGLDRALQKHFRKILAKKLKDTSTSQTIEETTTKLSDEEQKKQDLFQSIGILRSQINEQAKKIVSTESSQDIAKIKAQILGTLSQLEAQYPQGKIADFRSTAGDFKSSQATQDQYFTTEIRFISHYLSALSALSKPAKFNIAFNKKSDEKAEEEQKRRESELQEIDDFREQISPLISNLLGLITDNLLSESHSLATSEKKPEEFAVLHSSLVSLNSVLSGNKKLSLLNPKPKLSPTSSSILKEQLYVPDQEKKGKELAKIFLGGNLQQYNAEQITLILNNINALKESGEEFSEFLRVGAINFFQSPQTSDNLLLISQFIKEIPDAKIAEFEEYLHQSYQEFCLQDLDSIATFLVMVEDLLYPERTLEKEIIDQKLLDKKQELESDQKQPSHADNVRYQQNPITNNLHNLQLNGNFSIILLCKAHGKRAEDPHIKKSPIDLIKENQTTTTQELKDKLGCDVDQDLLDEIVNQIAENFFTNVQRRGSGSHNSCIKIPQILPNKKSPLSADEKKFYIANLEKLQQSLKEEKSPTR